MVEGITPAEARRFYNRFGRMQDLQWYEDRALACLAEHGRFDRAHCAFEFGCGTGRFAARALQQMPSDARYVGQDVSERMVDLSRERLEGDARVELRTSGDLRLPDADGSFDRFVATYALDLLPEDQITEVLAEAARVLASDGLVCVVALTEGERGFSRFISSSWAKIASTKPAWFGGCRPIRVAPRLGDGWALEHEEIVTTLGVSSEVVVARRLAG